MDFGNRCASSAATNAKKLLKQFNDDRSLPV